LFFFQKTSKKDKWAVIFSIAGKYGSLKDDKYHICVVERELFTCRRNLKLKYKQLKIRRNYYEFSKI